MRPKTYPLEPLRRLKKERAETKTRALAATVSAREAEQQKRVAAEAERDTSRARVDRTRVAERQALEQGELRASDLARAGAWEQRVAAEDEGRQRRVDDARADEERAHAAEARSRADAARAEAEAELVARHAGRWRTEARKAAEAREEEDLAEAVLPRRR